jgi:hypothetical protein
MKTKIILILNKYRQDKDCYHPPIYGVSEDRFEEVAKDMEEFFYNDYSKLKAQITKMRNGMNCEKSYGMGFKECPLFVGDCECPCEKWEMESEK